MGTRSQSPLYFKDINSHSKCMHWWKIKKPSPQWTLCTILVHIEPLSTLTLLYKWNDESSPGSTSIDLHSITTNLQSSYSVYSNFRTSDNQSMKVICHSLQVRLFVCRLIKDASNNVIWHLSNVFLIRGLSTKFKYWWPWNCHFKH